MLGSGQTLIVRESKGAIKVEWQLQSGTLIQPKTDGMSVVGVGASTDVRADTVKLNFSPTLVPIIKETLAKTLGELVDIGQKQKPGIAGFAERIKTGSHALVALTDEKGGVGTYSENASGSQFIMRTTPMAAFFGLFLQAQNLLVSSAPEIKTAIGADEELQACLQSMSNVANAWKTLAPGEFTALQSKYCNIGIAVTRSFALFLSPSLRASVSYALIGMVQKILQSSSRDDINDGIHLSIRDVLLNPNRLNGIKLLCNVAADAKAIDGTKDDRKGFFANTPVSGVGRQPSKK